MLSERCVFALRVGQKYQYPWSRMKFFGRSASSLAVFAALLGFGQMPAPPMSAHDASVKQYIHATWDTLSRSMTDCASLADPKVKGTPTLLYLPSELFPPPLVAALRAKCNVRIEMLPQRITRFGEIRPTDAPTPGLLYLPNPYVVPGGRFNEMYGWDSYFILLGLLRDGRVDLARGMVENFFFEIEHYGGILNANRTYYFTRSQPPFLTSMIRAVYQAEIRAPASSAGSSQRRAWLAHAYGYAKRDYALWTSPIHRAGGTGLARYFDVGEGPVPELGDDSAYYLDVIRWLLAHPQADPGYLVDAPDTPTPAELSHIAIVSCNPHASAVCARAHVNGRWLTRDFYQGDRAMRESGFDTSFRYGPFSGSTHHFSGVDLNSLLYKYERDMAWMAAQLDKPGDVTEWNRRAAARRAAIDKYLWNAVSGMYFDYDFIANKPSTYAYATTFYPLWAGAASPAQAAAVARHLGLFEQSAGLAMSATASGMQWDQPFGWAPVTWIAADGLARTGDFADALRLAVKFTHTVEANFERDHTIHEKYNVVTGSSDVQVSAGYKTNVVGFGWTNAVYLEMLHLLDSSVTRQLSRGKAGTPLLESADARQ